jgi:hypothetical protein
MNPVDVASPRMDHTLPRISVIPLTPHPAAENAPYVFQGMAGVNLFDTFEEEHMKTPSLPRYNTRPGHANTLPVRLSFLHHVFPPHYIHKYPGFSCIPQASH